MEQSDLMSAVRRQLSPDAKIEVPATWDEYERAHEVLDTEGSKYPRLWYDSTRQIAIIVAAPTPLHGAMVGELVGSLANSCNEILLRGGISEDIRRRVSQANYVTKHRRAGRGLTIREWDGALRYLDHDDQEMGLMVAFEVAVSQSYRSMQEAMSWSMFSIKRMKKKQRQPSSKPQMSSVFSSVGAPLDRWCETEVPLFGTLEKVVIETFRCEDANCPSGTVLDPTRSFVVIMDGQSSGEVIPPNLGRSSSETPSQVIF
ncbi:hypothetical protein V1508DRAFT_399325 [Lipomyces doorenjongii]|uniref:uncharacterized protein n=1 Tax=Lipomyces doorenjongii TaxID=383834 RepID=UPI0034CE997E